LRGKKFLSTACFQILNKFDFAFYSWFSDCLETFLLLIAGFIATVENKQKKLLKTLNPAVKSKNVFQKTAVFKWFKQ